MPADIARAAGGRFSGAPWEHRARRAHRTMRASQHANRSPCAGDLAAIYRGGTSAKASRKASSSKRSASSVKARRSPPADRPEWNPYQRDGSEWALTPAQQLQRKKAIISKHNILAEARSAPQSPQSAARRAQQRSEARRKKEGAPPGATTPASSKGRSSRKKAGKRKGASSSKRREATPLCGTPSDLSLSMDILASASPALRRSPALAAVLQNPSSSAQRTLGPLFEELLIADDGEPPRRAEEPHPHAPRDDSNKENVAPLAEAAAAGGVRAEDAAAGAGGAASEGGSAQSTLVDSILSRAAVDLDWYQHQAPDLDAPAPKGPPPAPAAELSAEDASLVDDLLRSFEAAHPDALEAAPAAAVAEEPPAPRSATPTPTPMPTAAPATSPAAAAPSAELEVVVGYSPRGPVVKAGAGVSSGSRGDWTVAFEG